MLKFSVGPKGRLHTKYHPHECDVSRLRGTNTLKSSLTKLKFYQNLILGLARLCNGWRSGVVVSGVRRMNEVNPRRARLVPGWVTVFGRVYQPTWSTQPCIPPESLNRVSTSAGVRAGMSPLPGGR